LAASNWGVAVVLATLLAACDAGGGSTTREDVAPPRDTLESKMASLDAGTYVPPDDPVVAEYVQALDALEDVCTNTRDDLADMVVRAQELLLNGGQEESLLGILRHVRQSLPANWPRSECTDEFSLYVADRGGQA
jgi:hypothetical protein